MDAPEDPLRGCPLYNRFSNKNRHSPVRIVRPFRATSGREQWH
jgi:hypothetical protein